MLLLLLQVSDERRWRPLLFSHCLAPSSFSSSICLSLCITFHRHHHHHHNYCCYLSEDIFRSESVGEKVASSSQKASGQRLQTAIMVILGRQRRSFTHSPSSLEYTNSFTTHSVCVCVFLPSSAFGLLIIIIAAHYRGERGGRRKVR